MVDDEIVVVARLVKPRTVKEFVDVDPRAFERKFRFSVQEEPFQ
jgi:hypothetical protein